MHGHGAAGGLRVAVAHGVQNLLVRVDGHGEQLLARDVGDRDHGRVDDRHQRLNDHVVRAFREKPVKAHILDEVVLSGLDLFAHRVAVFGQLLDLLVRAVLRRERRDRRLEHEPHVGQIERELQLVLDRVQTQRIGVEREQGRDVGARAVLDAQNAARDEQPDRLADGAPADLEMRRQLMLVRQLRPDLQMIVQNVRKQTLLDPFGQRLTFDARQLRHTEISLSFSVCAVFF